MVQEGRNAYSFKEFTAIDIKNNIQDSLEQQPVICGTPR
jgi:hypothetical protein